MFRLSLKPPKGLGQALWAQKKQVSTSKKPFGVRSNCLLFWIFHPKLKLKMTKISKICTFLLKFIPLARSPQKESDQTFGITENKYWESKNYFLLSHTLLV